MKDPICGKEVDPLRARGVAIADGEHFYFCSVEHKREFLRRRRDVWDEPTPLPPIVAMDHDHDHDHHDHDPHDAGPAEPARKPASVAVPIRPPTRMRTPWGFLVGLFRRFTL